MTQLQSKIVRKFEFPDLFFQTCSSRLLAISYNQPKFCSGATWKLNASTFVGSSVVKSDLFGIFINTNDTVHVTNGVNGQILIWPNSNNNQTLRILDGWNSTHSLFVTINSDIYVNGGYLYRNITKWIENTNSSAFIMNVQGPCSGLFVSIDDSLYYSMYDFHVVIKTSLNNNASTTKVVAGTGCSGITSNMLYNPQGIFVHTNLSLYVADCGNDRIQLFQYEESNGTTIAGNGAPGTIVLHCPSSIVFDGDEYLFIVDQNNHRIVGSEPNGFRCLVGCSGNGGSTSDKLMNPLSMALDSHGNIFVTDRGNNRVQKFTLATNSCGKCS